MVRQFCSYIKDWKHLCQLKYVYPSKCESSSSLWDQKPTRRTSERNNPTAILSVTESNRFQDSQTTKNFSSRNNISNRAEMDTKESGLRDSNCNVREKPRSRERRQESQRKKTVPNDDNNIRKEGYTNVDILTEEKIKKDAKQSKLNENDSANSYQPEVALRQIVVNKHRDYIHSNYSSCNNNAVRMSWLGSQSNYARKRRSRPHRRHRSNEWTQYPAERSYASFDRFGSKRQDDVHCLRKSSLEIANYLKSNLNKRSADYFRHRQSAVNNNNNNIGEMVLCGVNSSWQPGEEAESQVRRRVNVTSLDLGEETESQGRRRVNITPLDLGVEAEFQGRRRVNVTPLDLGVEAEFQGRRRVNITPLDPGEEAESQGRRRVNVTPLDPLLRNCGDIVDRHPSIYVSQTGLVNLFLRGGTLLEITVDKTLRLVDERLNIAVALNWRDKSCSVCHPQAVISMAETSADIDLYGKWQARMRSGNVLAADKHRSVWFDSIENYGSTKYDKHQFLNCSVDNTIDLVYSTSGYGPWVFKHSKEMVSTARFQRSHTGNTNVNLKDVRITQKYSGDLIITCGQNLIKMWPRFGSVEVQTASTYISIRPDQKIRGKQWNTFSFTCCPQRGLTISNRKMEVYLLQLGRIEFFKLPERMPLKQ